MDNMPLVALIFQSFPEEILLFTLGTVMFLKKLNWRNILFAAAISATASYFVRDLNIYFGLHTVIGVFVNYLLFYVFILREHFISVVASLFTLGYLLIIENLTTQPIAFYLGFSGLAEVWTNLPIRIVITYPSLFLIAITCYFIYKKQIFNVNLKGQVKKND